MKPMVTVAMSVHNEAVHLGEAVQSVLNQTYGEFEMLIVDDASTDGTIDVIREHASIDDRIVVLQNRRQLGLTCSLNLLLKEARGSIIVRMDGNDVAMPSRIDRQVSLLVDEALDMVWCNAIYIDDRGQTICQRHQVPLRETLSLLPHPNHIVHPGSAYRKSAVLEVGGYDKRYASGQDGELWCRLRDAGFRFGVIEEPLLKVRIERESVTGLRLKYPADMNIVYAKVCMTNGDPNKARYYMRRVQDPWQKWQLLLRWALGERLARGIKKLKPYSYDRVHRRP